jgi:hypothetical protein
VADDRSGDDMRRAYLRRFSEGWSTFHEDPPRLEQELIEPEPPGIVTRRPLNSREAYLQRFVHRWWSFHRAEDKEDAMIEGLVIGGALRIFGLALTAGLVWLVLEASRAIQWTVLTIITIAVTVVVVRNLYRGIEGRDQRD